MKIILLILTLIGALITTSSSIWSATHKLYKEDTNGRELLKSGWISIGLTITGLIITFSSGTLGYLNTKREAEAKAQKESEEKRVAFEKERQKQLEAMLSENRILLNQELNTSIIQAHQKYLIDQSKFDAQQREIEFTRDIILSSQPLKSLHFSWSFSGVQKGFFKFLKSQLKLSETYPETYEDIFTSLYGPLWK
jgi:hypothetical protein